MRPQSPSISSSLRLISNPTIRCPKSSYRGALVGQIPSQGRLCCRSHDCARSMSALQQEQNIVSKICRKCSVTDSEVDHCQCAACTEPSSNDYHVGLKAPQQVKGWISVYSVGVKSRRMYPEPASMNPDRAECAPAVLSEFEGNLRHHITAKKRTK